MSNHLPSLRLTSRPSLLLYMGPVLFLTIKLRPPLLTINRSSSNSKFIFSNGNFFRYRTSHLVCRLLLQNELSGLQFLELGIVLDHIGSIFCFKLPSVLNEPLSVFPNLRNIFVLPLKRLNDKSL